MDELIEKISSNMHKCMFDMATKFDEEQIGSPMLNRNACRFFCSISTARYELAGFKCPRFFLKKCYNYKKQSGKIKIEDINITKLDSVDILERSGKPFHIELYRSQIFIKSCNAKGLKKIIELGKQNKYMAFSVQTTDYEREYKGKSCRHFSMLFLDNAKKLVYHVDSNGHHDKNYEKIIEDMYERIFRELEYTYVYSNVWNKNNVKINDHHGRCVIMLHLVSHIAKKTELSLLYIFTHISNMSNHDRNCMIEGFENHMIKTHFNENFMKWRDILYTDLYDGVHKLFDTV